MRAARLGRVTAIALTGATLFMLPALAAPLELPTRKAGLWEIRMIMAGGQIPPQTIQQCTDANTDKDMLTSFGPMAKKMCAKQDMQKTANGMIIESTCNVSGVDTTSRTVIAGDLNSAYTVTISSDQAGAPADVPEKIDMTMDAKWLGACKAGQKAGDIVLPGGIRINVKEMNILRGLIPQH